MSVSDNYEVETAQGSTATIVVGIAWGFADSTELDVWVQKDDTGEIKRASDAEIVFTVNAAKTEVTVENAWPAEIAKAFVARLTPKTQTYSPAESVALNPASLEAALDKSTKIDQENDADIKIAIGYGSELDVYYSANGTSWHTPFAAGDLWFRMRYTDDGTWTEAIRMGGIDADSFTVDNVTMQIIAQVLSIKDLGVTTAKLAANGVTLAKMLQIARYGVLGRESAGAGNVEVIAGTAAGFALLKAADAAAQRTALALGALAVAGVDDATLEISGSTTRIKADGVDSPQIADDAVDTEHLATDSVGEDAASFPICKAWARINGSGTAAIDRDVGVASVTDNGTGNYTVTLDSAVSANACAVVSGKGADDDTLRDRCMVVRQESTTQFRILCFDSTVTALDFAVIYFAVFE